MPSILIGILIARNLNVELECLQISTPDYSGIVAFPLLMQFVSPVLGLAALGAMVLNGLVACDQFSPCAPGQRYGPSTGIPLLAEYHPSEYPSSSTQGTVRPGWAGRPPLLPVS